MSNMQNFQNSSRHTDPRAMDDASYTRLPSDKCEAIGFRELCSRFEKVSKCRQSKKKLSILFSRGLHEYLHVDGQSVYPLMRLVLPLMDRERGNFGVQVKSLLNLYIQVLGFTKHSSAAKKLRNWKLPDYDAASTAKAVAVGDFPRVLEDVLENRAGGEKRLTIGEVNSRLDELCRLSSNVQRKTWLMRLVRDCTPMEHKWIARIILKEVRIGLNGDRVLAFYHPDALVMYNTCTDLRKVLDTLTDTNVRVSQQVELGVPFAPMLAKRLQIFTVNRAMKGVAFVMEPKLDGERIICHKNGEKINLFTRNGNDYTSNYLPNLEKYLKNNVKAEQCILDGEVLAWDDVNQTYIPFGVNRTVANNEQLHQRQQEYDELLQNDRKTQRNQATKLSRWMVYVIFDIMYVRNAHVGTNIAGAPIRDDTLLMTKPLEQRHRVLQAIVKPAPKRLEIIDQRVVPAVSAAHTIRARHTAVMKYLDEVMTDNLEGLVLKDSSSQCMPGSRDGSWVKLKPDYIDEMGKTLDVIILAGYYGHGSRGGRLSNFLLGVADEQYNKTTPDSQIRYKSFCKVGTGYTMVELAGLIQELAPHAKPYDGTNSSTRPPHFRDWKPSKKDDVPHVWFEPKHSKILELKGYDITPTDQFSALVTMRFPRVAKIRNDKEWFECETLSTVRELGRSTKTLNHAIKASNITMEQLEKPKAKRSKLSTGRKLKNSSPMVQKEFRIVDLANVRITSQTFKGYGFHVVPGRDYEAGNGKDELQRKIFAAGGTLLANPGELVPGLQAHFVIAASARSHKVQNLIKNGHQDIYAPGWVDACVLARRVLQPSPSMIIYATPGTQASLQRSVDCFGDSFFDTFADIRSIKQLFKAMDRNPLYLTMPRQQIVEQLRLCDAQTQDEIDEYQPFTLHRYKIYGDMYEKLQVSSKIEEIAPTPMLSRVTSFGSMFSSRSGGSQSTTIKPGSHKTPTTHSSETSRQLQDEQTLDPVSGLKIRGLCLQLRLMGATISPTLCPGVTHVLVDPQHMPRREAIREQLGRLRQAQYEELETEGNANSVLQQRDHSTSCRVVALAWGRQVLDWQSPHVDPTKFAVSLKC